MPKDDHKTQKDASKLKSIKDLPKDYKSKSQLQQHIGDIMVHLDAVRRENQKLQAEKEQLEQKISHLEKILDNSVPQLGSGGNFQLDEVTIARMQLQKIGKIATVRELTNEEARRFEIFSKVLQNDHKLEKNVQPASRLKDVSPSRLVEIASKDPEEGSSEQ